MRVDRPNSGVRARIEKLRRCAEEGHPDLVGKIEEPVRIRVRRRAVEQHQRRSGRKPGRKPVPHHPPSCCIIKYFFIIPNITMQHKFFIVLDENIASTMRYTFWFPGCTT